MVPGANGVRLVLCEVASTGGWTWEEMEIWWYCQPWFTATQCEIIVSSTNSVLVWRMPTPQLWWSVLLYNSQQGHFPALLAQNTDWTCNVQHITHVLFCWASAQLLFFLETSHKTGHQLKWSLGTKTHKVLLHVFTNTFMGWGFYLITFYIFTNIEINVVTEARLLVRSLLKYL